MGAIAIRDALIDQLAALTALQTWLGGNHTIEDADDAAGHIYAHALPPPADGQRYTLAELTAYRPYVIIARDRYRAQRYSTSSGVASATFRLLFVESVSDPSDMQTPAETFETSVDAVLDELWTHALPEADALPLAATDIVEGPWRNSDEEHARQGVLHAIEASIDVGMEVG